MIEVQIEPEAGITEVEDLLVRSVEAALRRAGLDVERSGVTVVLTGDEELTRLNEQFRGREGPTDVLSFEFDDADLTGEMDGYLGDIVISVDRARAQAEAGGRALERELAVLAAHGALHLAGHDHAEEDEERTMFALQDVAASEALGG